MLSCLCVCVCATPGSSLHFCTSFPKEKVFVKPFNTCFFLITVSDIHPPLGGQSDFLPPFSDRWTDDISVKKKRLCECVCVYSLGRTGMLAA